MAKARVKMNTRGVMAAAAAGRRRGLAKCAMLVEREAKRLLSRGGGKSHKPSAPGQPPHVQTGTLRSSLGFAVLPTGRAIVGATEVYAKVHEHGTRGKGGTLPDIKAKSGALAVPIHQDARGKRPRDFGDQLVMVKRNGKAPLLIRSAGKTTKTRTTNMRMDIMYILLKSVSIAPRPFMYPALVRARRMFAKQFAGVIHK